MGVKTIKGRLSDVLRVLNGTLKQRASLMHALIFCLAVLPACLHLIIILKYGGNVPYRDDWERVWLFEETSQGTLSFNDLIAEQNDSRLFFPNLISIALAFLTGFDVRYEMLVTFLLACLVSFNVYRLVNITIGGSLLKRLSIYFLMNLFIFAPMQAENWLRALQYIYFVPIACITTCLSVAYSGLGTRTKFLICMIVSTISTFSYANGILCWIVILPVLALSRTWQDLISKRWLILAWVAGFALIAVLYLHGNQGGGSLYKMLPLTQPVQAFQFFLSFLGAPYSSAVTWLGRAYALGFLDLPVLDLAVILGGVLLLLFVSSCVYLLSLRNFALVRQTSGWLMIGAYSLVSALLTMFGRLHYGVEYSLQPRYPTFSLYLAVSLIPLIAILLSDVVREVTPSRGRLFATVFGSSLITLLVFLYILSSVHWAATIPARTSLKVSEGKACLLLINVVPDDECLNKINHADYTVDDLHGAAVIVNELGFLRPSLIESDKIRDVKGVGSGSVAYGEFDSLTKTDDGSYLASGWAISPKEERAADAVLLTYEDADGEPTIFAIIDGDTADGRRKVRKDVAEALGSDSYRRSGWEETFPASALPTSSTEISAWAFDAEAGKAFELEGNHDVGGTLGEAVRVEELVYRGAVYGQGSRDGTLG